ncbi:hypothetical protein EDD17DRAFT_1690552 [Pisolithus thermaeus]|nr:hypothetical protein EV401DRAFT_2278170 [Pisolithus croceorrhizus]KAI6165505.1 hypothetical protein EDD17DRAFT_1690552 [Pisolithus thermaeus]
MRSRRALFVVPSTYPHIFDFGGGPPDFLVVARPYLCLADKLYSNFGFVAGHDSEGEQVLPLVYKGLISKCSFTEFWTAF